MMAHNNYTYPTMPSSSSSYNNNNAMLVGAPHTAIVGSTAAAAADLPSTGGGGGGTSNNGAGGGGGEMATVPLFLPIASSTAVGGNSAANLFINFGACRITLDVGGRTFVTLLHTLAKDLHSLLGKVALELSHAAAVARIGTSVRTSNSHYHQLQTLTATTTSTASATTPSSPRSSPPVQSRNTVNNSSNNNSSSFANLLYAHGIIIEPSTLHVFIDRDPSTFAHILNCLRNMPMSHPPTTTGSSSSSSYLSGGGGGSRTPTHHYASAATTPENARRQQQQYGGGGGGTSPATASAANFCIPLIPLDMYEAVLAEARFFRLFDLYARLQEQYTVQLQRKQSTTGGISGGILGTTLGLPGGGGSSAAGTPTAEHQQHQQQQQQHHDTMLSTALDELRQLRQAVRDVQLCVTRSYDNGRFWVRA